MDRKAVLTTKTLYINVGPGVAELSLQKIVITFAKFSGELTHEERIFRGFVRPLQIIGA